MYIQYQVRFTACPKCNKRIRRGRRRFGPPQVQCGHCNEILQTNLPAWSDLTTGRKISVALSEIFSPSWISIPGFDRFIITPLIHIFFWGITLCPFAMAAELIRSLGGRISTTLLIILAVFIYPGILGMRLYKIIHESNLSTQNGQIPIWK